MLDASTAASLAAVVIAGVAFVVALGQVAQQYVSSGQLIRLCDSVVYGGSTGLPGRGRRFWTWSQFRFRVLYHVPVFALPAPAAADSVWNASPVSANKSDLDVNANEERLARLSVSPQVGEASWVSFCRKAKLPCEDYFVVRLVKADADRCPPDLPNVPVPVSLRDVTIMALAMGLECTEASFSRKTISMQGPAGSMTSSHHPLLGPVVHFTPQLAAHSEHKPFSWTSWVARLYGYIPVSSDLLPAHGNRGRAFYENTDKLLQCLRWLLVHRVNAPERVRQALLKPEAVLDDEDAGIKTFSKSTTLSSFGQKDPEDSALHIPGISWYWMCQMNVFSGLWATPWKKAVDPAVCYVGYSFLLILVMTDPSLKGKVKRVGLGELQQMFEHGLPFRSQPPYVTLAASRRTHPGFGDSSWHYYEDFDAHLPPLVLASAGGSVSMFTFHELFALAASQPTDFYLMELTKVDYWLSCAAGSAKIYAGPSSILNKVPAVVEYMLSAFFDRFRTCMATGIGEKACRREIREHLELIGLSSAERVFVMVAMIRTLKVGFCIGTGRDTLPALEILENDLPVHMV